MPFLRIQTNASLKEDRADKLLAAATKTVSAGLGKPESYVMVALEPDSLLMFAGSKEPAAMLELAGIDLAEHQAGRLASSLCSLMEERVEVAKDRVFIIFTSVERRMWGWDAATFCRKWATVDRQVDLSKHCRWQPVPTHVQYWRSPSTKAADRRWDCDRRRSRS